jgi:transposase
LAQAAWTAWHCKQEYLHVAHKILVTAYNILKTGPPYQDLGSDYFDNLHPERTTHRLVQRLERLGHSVVLEILPPANPQIP